MTYPIQPGPFFQAAPNLGKAAIHSLPQNFSKRTDIFTIRFPFSSSITTPWGKPSNLWISWAYSHRPRVPSWLWIRWIQFTSHSNNFKSPSTLAMSTVMQNSAQTSSHFILGQHFLEIFTLLSPKYQDHTFMDDDNVPVLNQQTQLLLFLWQQYLTHTFNNVLTVTLHIFLKHLAAKIPSQLRNYFLPSFLPSYETCSININPLFHAAIKTIIKTFQYLVSLSFIFQQHLARK